MSEAKRPEMFEFEYARSALKNGLKLEKELGVNPYKFGMVGSTDSHTGLATADDDNFFGKATPYEPSATRWNHAFNETEIPHQLAGILKARQIADLGQNRHCRNKIDPAHRQQGGDDLSKGPLGHRVTDRLLQTLDTLAILAHRPQKLFEHNPLLAMFQLLQHEPIHVGRPPRLLARIMPPEPKHERGDLLALAFEVFPRCLTGAREIAHRLMSLVRHPDRGEFPGAQYLGQAYRIASVRLHPIARFLRDERGRRHDAVVAKLPDQPIKPVSRRPRLVAKRQLTVFGRKFGDELARRRFRGVDLAEIANLPATTLFGNRNGIPQL